MKMPPTSTAVACAALSLMSATATLAPSRAKRKTIARPMPVAPPVTRATCFSSSTVESLRRTYLLRYHGTQQRQALVDDLARSVRAERRDLDLIAAEFVSIRRRDICPADIRISGKKGVFVGRRALDRHANFGKRLARHCHERNVFADRKGLQFKRPMRLALQAPGDLGSHRRTLAKHCLPADIVGTAAVVAQVIQACRVLLEFSFERSRVTKRLER